jgi:hypothetical protein
VAQALVPAFPSSTVAFSGTGPLTATMPFLLRGGTYKITWYSQAIGATGARTTWPLVGTIHEAAGSGRELPLLRVDMPIGGPQTGEATAGPFAEGTYILKVDADPLCNWTVQIHP